MSELTDQILNRRKTAEDYLTTKRDLWDEYENIFHCVLSDSISVNVTKSKVFDPIMGTLAMERSNRVMAQLPTGKVRGISKNDELSSKLMNLVLDKYVLPNANSQFDFMTKARMVDLYSNIYGSFFVFVDWMVNDRTGYIGPDMWMLNIRDVFPQVGAVSIDDSDFVIVRTWRSLEYFKSLSKQKGFKNVDKIITRLEKISGGKGSRDANSKSQRDENQFAEAITARKSGYFEVLSQYERDRWVDYVPAADKVGILRDNSNPHKNGELPVIAKHSQPLIDDIMGLGSFERGKTLGYANNSLWGLYLAGVQMSIFPPTLLNKANIADKASIQQSPGTFWLMRGNLSNSAQPLNTSPKGIATFNNTRQALLGSIYNMFSTTDTTTTKDSDPGFGKTPQALKMQQSRENTGDNADRYYMEQFLTKVLKRFVNLISTKQEGKTVLRLFQPEIEELVRQHPETEDLYNPKTGELTISKKQFADQLFDYEIVSGSTYSADEALQQSNLAMIMETFVKNPQMLQMMAQEGKRINFSELISRILTKSGIQDWDKIIVDAEGGQEGGQEEGGITEQDMGVLDEAEQQLNQALQGVAQGNPSEVPPTL